ncbi:macro domain-containing protein [Mycetocola reblochoni]|uniref:macro domain-containing protein n=1 Tax=Mycetocola reblochoni TaxID=331618 RepID=UPI003F97E059
MFLMTKPTIRIRIVEDDIFALTADAIVNPWNRNYWPRWLLAPGGLSGKLKERTTEEPWKQLAKLGLLPTGEVVVTGAEGLDGYRYIFHAIGLTFGWKATPDGVAQCARNIVRRAVERDVRTVTVPLIGAGHGKLPAEQSEAAILAGLADSAHVVGPGEEARLEVIVVRYPVGQKENPAMSENARAEDEASAAADFAEAQRELDAACEETGATVGCIRAPGGLSADALREVAKIIRQEVPPQKQRNGNVQTNNGR